MKMNRTNKSRQKRDGAAAIEFALTVPLLFLFLFGALEISRANMLRNMCENAAMEGARAGIVAGATNQDCIDAANVLINKLALQSTTITVEPATITPATESITVTIDLPLTENSLPMSRFVLGKTISQSVVLSRQRSR